MGAPEDGLYKCLFFSGKSLITQFLFLYKMFRLVQMDNDPFYNCSSNVIIIMAETACLNIFFSITRLFTVVEQISDCLGNCSTVCYKK